VVVQELLVKEMMGALAQLLVTTGLVAAAQEVRG
jgi:hypothetical protein